MQWVVEPEYVSCIVLAILFAYASFQRFASSPKQTAFRCSLLISLAAIVINIGSVHCIEDSARFPMWLNYSVSAWYFALTPLMVMSISVAALMLVYENRYESKGFRNAMLLHGLLYFICLLIVLGNGSTRMLFFFTENGDYLRGPLNKIILPFALFCFFTNLTCYLMQKSHVNRSFRAILISIPVISALFGLTQAISPNTMLTGSAAALSLLILFINGQLQRLNTDQLTQLGTREMFYRMIENNVKRGRPFHVLIISVRNYKDVNNRFGQRGGDAFLRAIGSFLLHLKQVDACRFTGVEFALITRPAGEAAYEALYADVRKRFSESWVTDGMEAFISASYADIAYPEIVSDVNDMIASLEFSTRLAKQNGDGSAVRFDKQAKGAFGRRNYIIALLHNAIAERTFFLNFQPVYDCHTGTLNGAEALVRLREDSGRPISPNEFIPLAEETGLVEEIGWQVLDMVLRFLAAHPELPLKWISVNVSAQQYQNPQFVERVAAMLEQYGVGKSVLKLEITERVLLDDVDIAGSIMQELKTIGVGTGLDDFGTGYSNLANVMSLPVEVVKIDKSYIDDIVTNPSAFGLLQTVVTAIRAMGMLVLVEGVETLEQLDLVKELTVDHVQGFYFHPPLEESSFIEAMLDQKTETA